MGVFIKDPNSVLDYKIDWTDWLEEDETITQSTWTVPDGLTQPASPTNTPKTTTVWLGEGVVDSSAVVVNRITTSAGRVNDHTIKFIIRNH